MSPDFLHLGFPKELTYDADQNTFNSPFCLDSTTADECHSVHGVAPCCYGFMQSAWPVYASLSFNPLDKPCRIASPDFIFRNLPGHNGARPDYSVISDVRDFQHGRSSTDEYVLPDDNPAGFCMLQISLPPKHRGERMKIRCIELASSTN